MNLKGNTLTTTCKRTWLRYCFESLQEHLLCSCMRHHAGYLLLQLASSQCYLIHGGAQRSTLLDEQAAWQAAQAGSWCPTAALLGRQQPPPPFRLTVLRKCAREYVICFVHPAACRTLATAHPR
jgi:hypothetical protein